MIFNKADNNLISLDKRREYIRLKTEYEAKKKAMELWRMSNKADKKVIQLRLREQAMDLILKYNL